MWFAAVATRNGTTEKPRRIGWIRDNNCRNGYETIRCMANELLKHTGIAKKSGGIMRNAKNPTMVRESPVIAKQTHIPGRYNITTWTRRNNRDMSHMTTPRRVAIEP